MVVVMKALIQKQKKIKRTLFKNHTPVVSGSRVVVLLIVVVVNATAVVVVLVFFHYFRC